MNSHPGVLLDALLDEARSCSHGIEAGAVVARDQGSSQGCEGLLLQEFRGSASSLRNKKDFVSNEFGKQWINARKAGFSTNFLELHFVI